MGVPHAFPVHIPPYPQISPQQSKVFKPYQAPSTLINPPPFLSGVGDVEAQRVVPDGVFCLFSALKFHNLTLENPHRLHMAVSRGTYVPRNELPVDFYRYSESAFEYGIEEHQTKDGRVRVYSVGKTLADCFKFRNVVGLDVFIAAVRDAREKNSIDYNTLWTAINVCRVAKAIRPYLEGML